MILSLRNVLITGGTGTLGRALVDAILTDAWGRPSSITIFSRGEDEQKEMAEAEDNGLLRFVPGDIRCASSQLPMWVTGQILIHCAAMKDIPQCEKYPWQAIETNVEGVTRTISLAMYRAHRMEKCVFVSSDKAVDPCGVYGCTKLLGERLVITAAQQQTDLGSSPVCSIVRLVNLWGSSGSVVPLFRRQIAAGGPVTITDPEMTRWFMWPSEAAAFILDTLADARPGEIAVPKAHKMRIIDIATALMIEADKQVEIRTIGIRPGEKLHEARIADHEERRTVYTREKAVIWPPYVSPPTGVCENLQVYDPRPLISPSAIVKMMKEKGA